MTAPHPLIRQHTDGQRCTVCGKRIDLDGSLTDATPQERRSHHDCCGTAEHIRKLVAAYPRCQACGRPMVAGQVGTHLSCVDSPDIRQSTFPAWLAWCQECESKKSFDDDDERDEWARRHRKDTGHRVQTGAGK